MASRGCGYGRGRGRGAIGSAKLGPFVPFPEGVELPDINNMTEEGNLVYLNWKLQTYWKSSPYYLEEATSNKNQDTEMERYSDRGKQKSQVKRDPLSYHMKLTSAYFPLELIHGSKRVQHDQRNVRWNPEAGLQKLDFLEKLEQKSQDHEKKGEKETKDGENEEEEGIEEADEEFSDDGDYNQNVDFDDDEDDFNMDVGDEGIHLDYNTAKDKPSNALELKIQSTIANMFPFFQRMGGSIKCMFHFSGLECG